MLDPRLACLLLVVGCSAEPVDSEIVVINSGDTGVASTDANPTDRVDDVDSSDGVDEETQVALGVSVSITGVRSQSPITLAVRDAATDEVVLFERFEEGGEARFEAPELLSRGGNYHVGVTTSYADCLSEYENTFFAELSEVVEDVELTFANEEGVAPDLRGCDVVHQPIQMPAGQYTQPDGVLDSGQAVSLIVSQTGRLYLKSAYALCNGGNVCSPSLITAGFGECKPHSARTPLPGDDVIELYADNSNGSGGDPTEFRATVVIDEDADVFRLTGEARTDLSDGGECCSRSLEFDLARRDDSTYECP